MYKRYKSTVLKKYDTLTDLSDICVAIDKIKNNVLRRKYDNRLIMILGYESLASDMELMGEDSGRYEYEESSVPSVEAPEDMSQVMEKIKACDSVEEKQRILADYNARVAEYQSQSVTADMQNNNPSGIYDARDDMKWIVKRASAYGIHFLFCFEQAKDFIDTGLDEHAFRHKLAFAMSREDSSEVIGSRKANEIETGVCLYSNGKDSYSMHPHIYRGVPCNGWQIDDNGKVVQRR